MGRAFEYRKASKLARWDKMAKTFSKIGKDIALAVKAGGPDPDSNPALRRCIQNAKGANMPKDNVERAIKKASGADAENYEEVTYEGYGQGGVAFFVECTTNNTTRTVANVRAIFNKFEGNLGKNGELAFIFDRKGIFTIEKTKITIDWDEFEMEMIDGGAEEIDQDEEEVMITTAFEDFGALSHKLDEIRSVADRVTVIRRGKSIETVEVSGTTSQDLAEMMVGRSVSFTTEKNPPQPKEVILSIKDLIE